VITATAPTSSLRRPVFGTVFGVYLSASTALHVGVLVAYAFYDSQRMAVLELPDEPIKATMVRLGRPRDEKLLPRLTTAPKPEAPAPSKALPVPTRDPPREKLVEPKDEPDDEKIQSAVDKIRERVEQDKTREAALKRIAQRVGKDEPDEGEEDGRPDGDSATPAQVNAYLASLKSAVKREFLVPSVIQPTACVRLVATVMVRMAGDGAVVEVKVSQSAGHELFDTAVVKAVRAASPLPTPPANMRQRFANGFGFKFRCAE
jgi:protein TonB